MYLIDTNILIYHFNDEIPKLARSELNNIFKTHFNVSIITKMEFLGFKRHTEESFQKAVEFMSFSNLIMIDNEIVNMVISIKRENNIKLPDAIIAATALGMKMTLITRNEKDFRNLDLDIYNPFKKVKK